MSIRNIRRKCLTKLFKIQLAVNIGVGKLKHQLYMVVLHLFAQFGQEGS